MLVSPVGTVDQPVMAGDGCANQSITLTPIVISRLP
jgi:hypothetical protein